MKDIKGLTKNEVIKLQEKYGKNELSSKKKESFFIKIINILCEPMFLLLIVAATIYFILGEPRDGLIMLIFVVGIITIDIIQEWKTDKTLSALKDLSEPKITVLRDNEKIEINSVDLVPGDIMYIYEGIKIPADGYVVKCSGLCCNESSLTGESVGVFKNNKEDYSTDYFKNNYCYQGTLVQQGTGIIKVDKIGNETEYGKIGKNISELGNTNSPLQIETDKLVMTCAIIAFILFVLVGFFTFLNIPDHSFKDRIIESILSGVTLAMAMIPEEFPVVLTVFLSMGAWRLAKKNSLVKKLPSVETLGAVSVLCVDKTGTITKNEMEIVDEYSVDSYDLAFTMALCCEEETYDPMEIAMLKYSKKLNINKKDIFSHKLIEDYPFDNDTKIMGKIKDINGVSMLCCKGSSENIINLCNLSDNKKNDVETKILKMQKLGLRVIAVAKKEVKKIRKDLLDYKLEFVGLVGLIDPPRDDIKKNIELCNKAGIRVIMITGDNGITASSIAKNVGIPNIENIITGNELNEMSDSELKERVKNVSIFSRVIPEHKMRIVKALQSNGEIVGMTGDGVNDAPALKQANIGIAMGKRGNEVSREAADLILMDDNFSTIVDTIKDGRRIYDNIKKAIGYIFVIHIPIALSSIIGPLMGINPSALMLLPLHVVLLEIIIDPTCSIVLERQPYESNIMDRSPRNIKKSIVSKNIIIKSFVQGLIIFLTSFITYYTILNSTKNADLARTMGLLIIIISNIFIVQVISSAYDYAFISIKKILKDKVIMTVNILMLIGILLITYSPLNNILKLQALSFKQFIFVIFTSFISVFWYEIIKYIKRNILK